MEERQPADEKPKQTMATGYAAISERLLAHDLKRAVWKWRNDGRPRKR